MTMCRQQASDHSEDDGIKTITYDEYVNAGIPDALLQGLGFAESLSHEPLDMDELSNDVSVPAKETDAPSVESSSVDIHPMNNLDDAVDQVEAAVSVARSHVGKSVQLRYP